MNLSMFPLIIIGLAMFGMILLSGRKQKRLQQQTQELQQDLNDGDVVMTTSGLRATVVDSSYEDTVDLEIAPGVITTWQRQAIRNRVDPTPSETDDDHDAHSDTVTSMNGKVGKVVDGGADTVARADDPEVSEPKSDVGTKADADASASDRGTA